MSWPIRSLAEVAPIRSRKPEFFDGARRYYSTGAVGKSGELDAPELVTFAERPSRANSMPRIGDVGFARMNGTQKVVLISEAELGSLFSTGFCFLEPNDRLDSKYLFYFLTSGGFQSQKNALAGEGIMGGIKNADVANMQIPLPPLSEQQRIVRLLDEALEGIAMAKANAEKNLQNVRALFDSHLQNVFTQGGASWKATSLQELFAIGSSKRVLKSDWKTKGVPFYRGREITKLAAEGFVDNELFISETHFAQLVEKFGAPTQGDVMITAIGTIGNVYIVRESDRFYFKDASVLWMKKASQVDSSWIKFWLSSQAFLDQLDRGNGATVDTLTVEKLRNMTVLVPSLAEQRQIASLLDDLQVFTDDLARICTVKQVLLEDLKVSLLHQAFSGNLEAA